MPTKTQTPATELPTQPDQQQAISYFLTSLQHCHRGNYCTVNEVKSDAEAVFFRMKHPDALYKNEHGIIFNISIQAPRWDEWDDDLREMPTPVFLNKKFSILKKYLKSIKYEQIAKMNIDDWEYKYKVFSWDSSENLEETMNWEYFPQGNHVVFGTIEDKNQPYEDIRIEIETTNFEIACQMALLFDEKLYINDPTLPRFLSQRSIE